MFKHKTVVLLLGLIFSFSNTNYKAMDLGFIERNGIVGTCVQEQPFDESVVDRIDAILEGRPLDPTTYKEKKMFVELEKVAQELLARAREKSGLDKYGSMHWTTLNVYNWATAFLVYVLCIIIAVYGESRKSERNGSFNNNSIEIGNKYYGSTKPETSLDKSREYDITNSTWTTSASTIFWVYPISLILRAALIRSWPCKLEVCLWLAMIAPMLFIFQYSFARIFEHWKKVAQSKTQEEFQRNLHVVTQDLLTVARKSVSITSKDPKISAQLEKIFGNNLPMDQRKALLNKREFYREQIKEQIIRLIIDCTNKPELVI